MDKKVRAPHLWEIIVALLLLVVVLSIAIGVLNVDTYGPFILVIAFTSVMAMRMGLGWKEIQQAILSSLQSVLQALLILIMVGMVISTWIQGGIVPSLIYYGLRMIHPNIFLVTIFLVCSICAVATGSSWTIIGTLGIAAIGISQGIGIPVYITTGIVVSAAYFGDKLSPLSDTPNLHCAIVGVNLFENFKNVLRNTLPSYFIALILCVVVGFCYQTENGGSLSEIQLMTETLAENFVISPWLILPVLSVFAVILLKIPAIPGILFMAFIGAFCGIFVQGETIAAVMKTAYSGFVGNTEVEMVNSLLSRGGILSMMPTVLLIFCAVSYGGILEVSGILQFFLERMMRFVKKDETLITLTVISCVVVNLFAMDNYVTAVICGNMFQDAYVERGLSPLNLTRCLAESASVVSPLIPWNTCGIVVFGMLGISPLQYGPYAFLCWLAPIMVILLSHWKIGLVYLEK